jgi:hypothetical protein
VVQEMQVQVQVMDAHLSGMVADFGCCYQGLWQVME